MLRRICVYCGSRPGNSPRYAAAAQALGRLLAERQIELVFGGGSVGMMGLLADAVLDGGGHVIGVIPELLAVKELLHPGVADMRLVKDMHARKKLMAELSDGFIALAGGFGTFEELFETVTWAQLGIHRKPIGLLNTAGYFDGLLTFLDRSFDDGFIQPIYRSLYLVGSEPQELLDRLPRHQLPVVETWVSSDQV